MTTARARINSWQLIFALSYYFALFRTKDSDSYSKTGAHFSQKHCEITEWSWVVTRHRVTSDMDPKLPSYLSGGAIVGCRGYNDVPLAGSCKVSDSRVLARQLAGQQIPFNAESLNYLVLDKSSRAESIIQASNGVGEILLPVFVKTTVDGREVFLLTQIQFSDSSKDPMCRMDSESFLEIAPIMMFLRYACGERCWHSASSRELCWAWNWNIFPHGTNREEKMLNSITNFWQTWKV
jgi:hypothetical protein